MDTVYQRPPDRPTDVSPFAPGERMPAFPCSGAGPDFATATEEEKEKYHRCASNAMLDYVYSSIEYPKSARKLGYGGTPEFRLD